jgi:Flp pilus assembly protein TadB
MIIIAKLCALASIIYLVKVFLYPIYKPVNSNQKKRARRFMKERNSAAIKEKLYQIKRKFALKYVRRLVGNVQRLRLQKMIDRLDLMIKPEEVRADQILYSLGALLLTALMMSANQLLGYVTAIFIILGWLYPVSELEKKIEKKNKNIALDFPAFYSMVYYQYAKSVNIYLADVIRDYLPNANSDMAEELGVMLDNIDYGEEYALKQFKKRIPMHYIIKFCDIMETRLKGYDNVSQMVYLKNEVDEYRIRALEDDLKARERSNAKIQFLLIIVLGIYIVIYYLFMILDSMKMFQ